MKDPSIRIISGIRIRRIQLRILIRIYLISSRVYRGPIKAIKGIRELLEMRKLTHNHNMLDRMVRSGDKYHSTENLPGFPSRAYDQFIERELVRLHEGKKELPDLHTVIFSITSRCELKCKHCYEWDNISPREHLSLEELRKILDKLLGYGVSHVQLSGGEPLNRFDDLITLIEEHKNSSDFWLLSSGMNLTREKALKLKAAGLTGSIISLDHWKADEHNQFRNHPESFQWVEKAVNNCNAAGLIPALSLCVTREFLSEENLRQYTNLAREWNIGFIRLLEPRAVGGFKNQQVHLSGKEKKVIENFFLEITSGKKYRDYPLVTYPGFHQKNHGCFGAGNRYIHIDARGDVHACPFCQDAAGNMLNDDLHHMIIKLRKRGCHMFISG